MCDSDSRQVCTFRWFDAFQVVTFDDTDNYKIYVDSNAHGDFVTGIQVDYSPLEIQTFDSPPV